MLWNGRRYKAALLSGLGTQIEDHIKELLSKHSILGKAFVYDGKRYLPQIKKESDEINMVLKMFGIDIKEQEFHSLETPLFERSSPLNYLN